MRRLTPEEAGRHLEDARFGIVPGRWISEVFAVADGLAPPDRAALAARCEALVDSVPGFECQLGLDAYQSARAADDLVATLLG